MLVHRFWRASLVVAVGLGMSITGPVARAQASPGSPERTCTGALLPVPAGSDGGEVVGTDGHGTYVGDVFLRTEGNHGVLWDRHGFTDLGLGFLASDVNKKGVIVGDLRDDVSFVPHAAVMRGGVPTRLPEPAGSIQSLVTAIDDRGDAVGTAFDQSGSSEAVVWPAAAPDRVVPLAIPSGMAATVRAEGIDDHGRIVGTAVTSGFFGTERGVVWRTDGSVIHLLGQLDPGGSQVAAEISRGRVVGEVSLPSGEFVPVEWDADGNATVLPGGDSASPRSVNRAGVIGGEQFPGADGTGRVGPLMWVDGELMTIPDPPGTSEGGIALVGDDHTMAGTVGPFPPRPALWTCPGSLF